MRIAFDSRRLGDPCGIGRYSRCLLEALRAHPPAGAELVEARRPGRADVFHSPWVDGAPLRSPCPLVVTLHDLATFNRASEYLRPSVRPRLRALAVQRAARVIASSEALADEALEAIGLERERVAVIPQAPAATMYPRPQSRIAAARARFRLPERYLVWVGGLQHPDPDNKVAELAAAQHELPLVLVGPAAPWARKLSRATLTGQVGDEDLAAIYGGAHALVITSEHAGFGLAAIEALACGTPVAACDTPALRELLDGRARFAPRGDLGALMRAAEAATRPAPPPPRWSWDDAARATWAVYEQAAAQRSRIRAGARAMRRVMALGPERPVMRPQ